MTNTPTQKPVLPEAVQRMKQICDDSYQLSDEEWSKKYGEKKYWEVIQQELITARAEERMRILNSLPRKFWEDEDHAVGGYISKKDLKDLLTSQGAS